MRGRDRELNISMQPALSKLHTHSLTVKTHATYPSKDLSRSRQVASGHQTCVQGNSAPARAQGSGFRADQYRWVESITSGLSLPFVRSDALPVVCVVMRAALHNVYTLGIGPTIEDPV